MPDVNQNLLQRLHGLAAGAPLGWDWHRWRLIRVLGRGAMGVVVEAVDGHDRFARPVALKFSTESLSGALLKEGGAAHWVEHPNLVRIDGGGEFQGVYYLVMERLEGKPGDDLPPEFRRDRRLLDLLIDLAGGLAELHRRGFLHRDLKPGNTFLVVRPGQAPVGKLIDFGLARDEAVDAAGIGTGAANGTVIYQAPERFSLRASERGSTRQTDVFAFGLTVVAMVTGEHLYADVLGFPPHQHQSEMAKAVVGVEARVHQLVPVLDDACPGLGVVVRRCLRYPVRARHPDGKAVLEDLKGLLRPRLAPVETVLTQVPAPPVVVGVPAPAHKGAGRGSTLGWVRVVVGVVLAGCCTLTAWLVETRRLSPLPASVVTKAIPPTGADARMGSAEGVGRPDEHPQHAVTLSGLFAMEHEVTQGEWESLMGTVPRGLFATGPSIPVANVSWCDAVAYANALTAQANRSRVGLVAAYTLPAGFVAGLGADACSALAGQVRLVSNANGYRLPTEAEWEWMARGGTGDRYEFSGGATVLGVAWVVENSGNQPHEVCTASVPRNGYALCDLTGNVWEWTWDVSNADFYGTAGALLANPTGSEAGPYRVYRGGGWNDTAVLARVASRFGAYPGVRLVNLGFRLVRSSGPL